MTEEISYVVSFEDITNHQSTSRFCQYDIVLTKIYSIFNIDSQFLLSIECIVIHIPRSHSLSFPFFVASAFGKQNSFTKFSMSTWVPHSTHSNIRGWLMGAVSSLWAVVVYDNFLIGVCLPSSKGRNLENWENRRICPCDSENKSTKSER